MNLMAKKQPSLFIKTQELSPIRKPRFSRTQSNDFSTEKRFYKTNIVANSNNSSDQLGIQVKFVKPVVHDGSSRHSPLRHNRQQQKLGLLIESRLNAYKRSVTPFKTQTIKKDYSSSYLEKLISQIKDLQNTILNKQVEIAQLEDQNQKLKQKNSCINALEQQKTNTMILCKELQVLLEDKTKRLNSLQDTLKVNEQSLNKTRDSLQKLRKQIQQNRIQDLQKQKKLLNQKIILLQKRLTFEHEQVKKMDTLNTQLQKNIQVLIQNNQKLQKQIFSKSITVGVLKQQSLSKQIQNLRQQLNSSQSQHQKYLQSVISNQKVQILELKQTNKVLYIKLDVVMKKYQQKEKEKKKNKDKQFTQLQTKFRKFLLEYRDFRKQHNQLLKKNLDVVKFQKRAYINGSSTQDDDSVSLSYSLTPERSLA